MLEQARNVRPDLKACIAITRKVARTALGKNAREVLASSGLPVLTTELHHRVAYQEAPAAGLGVVQYAPDTPAATEVQTLVAELDKFNKEGASNEADDSHTQAVA